MGEPRADPGSFRDPLSRVFHRDGRVLRGLTAEALREFDVVQAAPFFAEAVARGRIIGTERVVDGPVSVGLGSEWAAVLEHPTVPVWTYPYEWPFSMLQDAARLQLELLEAALADDVTGKDASPYNIQFAGVRPVFIDVGSFERYRAGDPWFGYLQFCRLYLFPLLLQAHADIAFHGRLRGSIDGIEPGEAWRLLGPLRLARRGVPTHVALHAFAQRRSTDSANEVRAALVRGGYGRHLVEANVKGLHRLVDRLEWRPSESTWSTYRTSGHYTRSDIAAKEAFVRAAVEGRGYRRAWDVGCNEGRFSRLIAREIEHVIAFDRDHLVVDLVYRALRAEGIRNITPLVIDLADPSPGIGWANRERAAFLDRCRPDFVLALAVVHHLALSGNVPTEAVLDLVHGLGADTVIEFPTEHDPMVKRLLAAKRPGVHDGYDLTTFEAQVGDRFEVRHREVLETRVLFELTPR